MSKKICVAMIIQAYHPIIGGAERQLGTIAPLLHDRGLEVHILTRKYHGLSPFEMIDDIPVHRLPIPGPMPVASLIFTLSGLRMLRKINPDVIHAHELLSPTTTAVTAKLLFNYPVVAKVLGGGSMGDISKLQRNRISAVRVKTVLNLVDKFITINREIGKELIQIGIPPEKQVYIPNGVDIHRFKPISITEKKVLIEKLNLPSGILCTYTGRLDEEKNVSGLVSIWKNIRQEFPEALLLIIGTGTEQKALQEIASEGVILLGNKDDIAPYLQVSDLFILPSKREGLSNALLEALACGLPAVATDVGGNSELVHSGVNGMLVKPGDSEDLQSAISGLIRDETTRVQMGGESRKFIQENYPIENTIDRLINLYQDVRSEQIYQ